MGGRGASGGVNRANKIAGVRIEINGTTLEFREENGMLVNYSGATPEVVQGITLKDVIRNAEASGNTVQKLTSKAIAAAEKQRAANRKETNKFLDQNDARNKHSMQFAKAGRFATRNKRK